MHVKNIIAALAACALFFALPEARAQTSAQSGAWPAKPIRWIVPFPPGGPADIVARLMAHKLGERVAQPAIVENRGGAGGNVGHDAVVSAAPDGYTLLFVVPSIITNPYYIKTAVDPFRGLAPVIHLDNASMVLLASNAFPAANVTEVLARIRERPGAVSCGSSGALPTVGCEMLRANAGADIIMVQYKGNAPALNAVMSGEINLLFDVVNTAAAQVKAGRARAVASTNPKRGVAPFADLPVVAETIPDFVLVTWHGVMAPRGTPGEIVTRLNRELNWVLDQPDVRARLAESGFVITGGTPEAFDALLKKDFARYGKILSAAGVKPE